MEVLQLTILIPFAIGIAAIFLPKGFFKYGSIFAVFSSLALMTGGLYGFPEYDFAASGGFLLHGEMLPLVLIVLTGLFGLLIALYSIGHLDEMPSMFWALFCWLLGSTASVLLAGNITYLVVAWGITGIVLALMIWLTGNEDIGKKTFIIVGGSDAVLLFGMLALGTMNGFNIVSPTPMGLDSPISWGIFISILIAALTKAGAMPFHTWIPDVSRDAPIPVVALLPSSVDKFLGIYLLKKLVMDWFVMPASANLIMCVIGSVTIIAAVFMALSQHNLRRLLGYHSVSQAGYMVLGLGTGSILGILGGLFHMINNSIYKQCLFLGAGIIEKETGTSKLEELGALFKRFPVTFFSFTISAMAISGLPLLNGFISKWMIYQGIVSSAGNNSKIWVIWLIAAVFGSALTLASFVKIVHAAFLGQPAKGRFSHKENLGWELPALIILPLMCIVIGLFPQYTIYPLLNNVAGATISMPGTWDPNMAGILILFGIIFSYLLYSATGVKKLRRSKTYIGGEQVTPAMRVSGVEFYTTIESISIFPKIYGWARKGYFDIYEILKEFTFYVIKILRYLHTGVLSVYVLWVMVGSIVLAYVFLK